jgi:signal recognition particle receptor subunit beta
MDRLKSARSSSGGRIEGISSVSGGGGSWWSRLFGSQNAGVASEGEAEVEDENLIWGGKGEFRWEDIEGVEVQWGCSGLGMVDLKSRVERGDVDSGDGLKDIREFLWAI